MSSRHAFSTSPFLPSRGMTLIELMVAMAVSLIVLLAVGTVYFSTKRSYNIQDQYSRMQQNALYAFQRLSRDISSSGYAGCSPVIKNKLDMTSTNPNIFDYGNGIYGWEYQNTGPGQTITLSDPLALGNASNWSDNTTPTPLPLDATIASKALAGSDVLVIKSAQESRNPSLQTPSSDVNPGDPKINFTTSNGTGIAQGAVMLVSDCQSADLFMNSATATDAYLSRDTNCGGYKPCNKTDYWSKAYKAQYLHIYHSTSSAYFVGVGANGEPALFRTSYATGTTSPPEELVDGVENMQILYGVSTNPNTLKGTANHYVTFNQVAKPANPTKPTPIYAVRISLLMRTSKNLNRPKAQNKYLLNGIDTATATTVINAKDSRMRQVFTTTIALRNMTVKGRK